MEGTRFDALMRAASQTRTRRGVVRSMAAAGLGVGLARIGIGEALAGKKKKKHKKKKKSEQQNTTPLSPLSTPCSESGQCESGLICQPMNAMNGCFASTEQRCCKPEGARCDDGCECCGVSVICNGHYCQSA